MKLQEKKNSSQKNGPEEDHTMNEMDYNCQIITESNNFEQT